MRKSFFISFYSLARLSREVRDKFLRLKLIKKTNSFFNNFLEAERLPHCTTYEVVHVAQSDFTTSGDIVKSGHIVQRKEYVAQYGRLIKNLLGSVDEILEFLEMLAYLKKLDLSPILLVQKNLLNFKSKVLDSAQIEIVPAKERILKEERSDDPDFGLVRDQKEKRGTNVKNRDLNEKIMEILKSSNGIQPKELVTALKSRFSRRTVQRYLNTLLASGQILKKKEAGYSKYFITN